MKLLEGGNATGGRTKLYARILRGKGVQKKKPNMFTVGSSTSATFVLPGTKFMLLESFTKHPSRSTVDHIFKSVLCGSCGTVNDHPLVDI